MHDVMEPSRFRELASAIEQQVGEAIVGQRRAVRGVLTTLVLGGHALLEGVPGIGKTTLVRAFASAVRGSYSRIQFTPDLMPADITGTVTLVESPEGPPRLTFQRGPIFAGLVLADEINRASPRTQSALLQAMQEGLVTAGTTTYSLPSPFSVLATQNPIELQGTYPLPEAQLDRFLLELRFDYPDEQELTEIVRSTAESADPVSAESVATTEDLLEMGRLARAIPAASHVLDFISRLVLALQPQAAASADVTRYVRLGPSPRAAQALSLAGRVEALLAGRHHLAIDDVAAVAPDALRHRVIRSFDAQRDDVTADALVAGVLQEQLDVVRR
jgi:MoxR-like ATPase